MLTELNAIRIRTRMNEIAKNANMNPSPKPNPCFRSSLNDIRIKVVR